MAEERSSLPSGVPAVQGNYAGESAETRTCFRMNCGTGAARSPGLRSKTKR